MSGIIPQQTFKQLGQSGYQTSNTLTIPVNVPVGTQLLVVGIVTNYVNAYGDNNISSVNLGMQSATLLPNSLAIGDDVILSVQTVVYYIETPLPGAADLVISGVLGREITILGDVRGYNTVNPASPISFTTTTTNVIEGISKRILIPAILQDDDQLVIDLLGFTYEANEPAPPIPFIQNLTSGQPIPADDRQNIFFMTGQPENGYGTQATGVRNVIYNSVSQYYIAGTSGVPPVTQDGYVAATTYTINGLSLGRVGSTTSIAPGSSTSPHVSGQPITVIAQVETAFPGPLTGQVVFFLQSATGEDIFGLGTACLDPITLTATIVSTEVTFVDTYTLFAIFSPLSGDCTIGPSQVSGSQAQMPFAIVPICITGNSLVTMADGTSKEIRLLKRGDDVKRANGAIEKVSKINRLELSPHAIVSLVVVKKNAFAPGVPSADLIMTERHPIIRDGVRIPAVNFIKHRGVTYHKNAVVEKVLPIESDGVYRLYDITFDTDGDYIANGVPVQSHSPWCHADPLDLESYFDKTNYRTERSWNCQNHSLPWSNKIFPRKK